MVNVGSIEEFDRINNRYEFLNNQKTDLFEATNTLSSLGAITEVIKEKK